MMMIRKKHFVSILLVSFVAVSSGTALAADNKEVPATSNKEVSVDVAYWKPGVKGGDGIHTPHSETLNPKNDLGFGTRK
jgi:hypothetical protein